MWDLTIKFCLLKWPIVTHDRPAHAVHSTRIDAGLTSTHALSICFLSNQITCTSIERVLIQRSINCHPSRVFIAVASASFSAENVSILFPTFEFTRRWPQRYSQDIPLDRPTSSSNGRHPSRVTWDTSVYLSAAPRNSFCPVLKYTWQRFTFSCNERHQLYRIVDGHVSDAPLFNLLLVIRCSTSSSLHVCLARTLINFTHGSDWGRIGGARGVRAGVIAGCRG